MTDPLDRAAAARRAAAVAREQSHAIEREVQETRRRSGELLIIARRIAGEATLLRLVGSLDVASAGAVREEVAARRDAEPAIRLDLAGVEFMDSSGLRLLLGLSDGDGLRLERPSAAVMRVIEVTGTAAQLKL
jgi:anti-sigma B factor antagonist